MGRRADAEAWLGVHKSKNGVPLYKTDLGASHRSCPHQHNSGKADRGVSAWSPATSQATADKPRQYKPRQYLNQLSRHHLDSAR